MIYDGALTEAFFLLFSWPIIGYAILGILIGIFIGAIPGIGPSVGMTIALPLTVLIEPTAAIIFLFTIYMGGMYGGSISAIIMNVPGTAGSAASTFDGYPLSRGGLALNALAISATSSAIGGLVGVILLLVSVPVIVAIVVAFRSPDFFLIAFIGLAMIAIIARGSLWKGLIAGFIGILYSTVGVAPITADIRYTFGRLELFDGLHLIPAILGVFAIAEMIKLSGEEGSIAKGNINLSGSAIDGIRSTLKYPAILGKSGLIGTAIGALPGAGASLANFVSYTEVVRSTKDNPKFGEGDERGLIASEASNNAAVGGSLVPTLSFGIPGSGAAAILLGALILHGLNPGPTLFDESLHITLSLYLALGFGAMFVIPVVGLLVVTRASYLTKINTDYIIPIVVVLSMIGVYTIRANWFDVITVVVVGLLGYFMVKHGYSIIAFVLGVILGPIAEQNLFRSLQLSDGSLMIFIQRPMSIALIILLILVLSAGIYDSVKED